MKRVYKMIIEPSILELLGPNLYTNIYYALAELIANAYDADANNVYIIYGPNYIRVEDDGHGMSYEKKDIDKFLEVAKISRTNECDSFTRSGKRHKMGRKGIGKLAALSVSENVRVLTTQNNEKSGFILSRHPRNKELLDPIPDNEITFERISGDGTAIVMLEPQYKLPKNMGSIKRNLLKLFPLVDGDFRIHLIHGNEVVVIDRYDENIMTELCAIITLGETNKRLISKVPDGHPNYRNELVESRDSYKEILELSDTFGECHKYELVIEGWIGVYKSTRGKKASVSDFPDNFISLFSNNKMGEFNILPTVGQNKLNEVYVVGQLFIDLFEQSELPDMALSNRQGYKTDDPRYKTVIEYVRNQLLPDILRKRDRYTSIVNAGKEKQKYKKDKRAEMEFGQNVESFKRKTIQRIISEITISDKSTAAVVENIINENMSLLDIKKEIDRNKKKILISHTSEDKALADIIYQMLLYNNVPAEDILYTSCDDEVCRVPEGVSIYDYLRDFFVESYSKQKMYVLFVTSSNTKKSWGAISEVGAAWITQVENKIFNIPPFKPEHPLNDQIVWHSTKRDRYGNLSMAKNDADVFCQKIEDVCKKLNYKKRTREDNRRYLSTLVDIN